MKMKLMQGMFLTTAMILVCTSCSTWYYKQTQDKSTVLGRSQETLSLAQGPVRIQFAVPRGYKIVSCIDEPLDWHYVASSPIDTFQFGVMMTRSSKEMSLAERHQNYLNDIQTTHDPKIRINPGRAFVLKDGRAITGYHYFSDYWGRRLVVIVPEGVYSTLFEFSASTQDELKKHQAEIQSILSTYSSKKNKKA